MNGRTYPPLSGGNTVHSLLASTLASDVWNTFFAAQVAKIVAETMNKYYLDGKYLVAKHIPGKDAHPQLFHGANRRFRVVPWRSVERQRRAQSVSETQLVKRAGKLLASERKSNKKLRESGIVFDPPSFQSPVPSRKKRSRDEEAAGLNSDSKQLHAGSALASIPREQTIDGTAVDHSVLVNHRQRGKVKSGPIHVGNTSKGVSGKPNNLLGLSKGKYDKSMRSSTGSVGTKGPKDDSGRKTTDGEDEDSSSS